MDAYQIAQKKRALRQIAMTIVFFAVIIGGWFFPYLGYFIIACMIAGLSIAFFQGRKWCDWYCPRGSFFDVLAKPVSPKKPIPPLVKTLWFRLVIALVLFALMITQIVRRWPDFAAIGLFFVVLLTVTSTIGFVLAIFFHQRIWCTVCPIGTFSHVIGRRKKPLFIDSKDCTSCTLCEKVCPMHIAPHQYKKDGVEKIIEGDCVKCDLCIARCPQKTLSRSKGEGS